LVREFVDSGGRAVITCVDLSRLDSSWLGRVIDERFLDEIGDTNSDPSGENGEFHSFAFQGPAFIRPVSWRPGEMRSEPGFGQLDVVPA
jgi:diphthamide synthase (EF-2-diphthine--ammonia ligase)